MHAKIIEVIEVTEFVEEPMFGDQGGSIALRQKRRFFLPDGSELSADGRDVVPAQVPVSPKVHIHHHEDGSISGSII
jgi:hypothetical protein